jgi:hypothetical protein
MKIRVTILADDKLWEKFKIRAIKKKMSYSKLFEKCIKRELA